jgi:hypothetical protein
VNASLAVVPRSEERSRPDIAWIKKNVPILAVGKALGLRIRRRRAQCWRPENHTHGDINPSLSFYEKGNRVRCFVCDMRGGHSNIDLVMGVLGVSAGEAVRWVAERFAVPNVKPGRPVGSRSDDSVLPYRVGVSGSDFEILVRSGTFGQFSPAERSILLTLLAFKDAETGITKLSYRAIMRYAGVGSRANVSNALKLLQKLHAVQMSRGSRIIGITRECNTYRVTLEDPKFLELCNAVNRATREEVERERTYRRELRAARAKAARHSNPMSQKEREESKDTCEGLNLSSISELNSNKAVPIQNREIGVFAEMESLQDALWMLREREMMNRQETEGRSCD